MYKEWFHQLCNPFPNNLPYIGHTRNPCCLSFSFQFLFKELGIVGCVGDGGMAWGDVIVYMNEWMNEKRIKWSKRFLGQVSSLQFLPSFSEISSCLVVAFGEEALTCECPPLVAFGEETLTCECRPIVAFGEEALTYECQPVVGLWWRGSSYIRMPTGS